MPDYISEKQYMKEVIERWENEGGKLSVELAKMPEDSSSGKRRREKNSSQISRVVSAAFVTPSD